MKLIQDFTCYKITHRGIGYPYHTTDLWSHYSPEKTKEYLRENNNKIHGIQGEYDSYTWEIDSEATMDGSGLILFLDKNSKYELQYTIKDNLIYIMYPFYD